jgi:hypothetical protein
MSLTRQEAETKARSLITRINDLMRELEDVLAVEHRTPWSINAITARHGLRKIANDLAILVATVISPVDKMRK